MCGRDRADANAQYEQQYCGERFMGRLDARARKFAQAGLVLSVVTWLGVVAALVLMLQKWDFQENLISVGPRRSPAILLALAGAIVCGVAGLLMSLEGPARLTDQWRGYGWVGFWLGAVGTMAAIVLGLCFHFYKF